MVSHGFLMVSYGSISFMCLPKVSSQNPPYALWPRIVVSAPNIMRELCGNHTLSLSPTFHPLPSFTAYPQLPNLFPTSHPFPSFPPSPPRLAQFPIDFILISYCFSYDFLWFPVDLNPPIRSSDQSRDKCSKYYAWIMREPYFAASPQLFTNCPASQPLPNVPAFP